jgi:type II secretory pathway component PulC
VFHAFQLVDGDMLLSVGGVVLKSPESLVDAFKVVRSSQVVIVELVRQGEPRQIVISIVEP